jgi:hypothetical protein
MSLTDSPVSSPRSRSAASTSAGSRKDVGGASDTPVTLRPPQDVRAWLTSESERRGISRSALIIEAVKEKRDRETADA